MQEHSLQHLEILYQIEPPFCDIYPLLSRYPTVSCLSLRSFAGLVTGIAVCFKNNISIILRKLSGWHASLIPFLPCNTTTTTMGKSLGFGAIS